MKNVYETLKERGFVQQCTNEDALSNLLSKEKTTFYAGFDPTADSLHAGSLLPIMAMAHLQRAGHRPIAIIGGGTTMIGDPSGKTEMRKMLSLKEIETNGIKILEQLKRYLDFTEGHGLFLNNSEWLLKIKYIDFLRDIGKHFRVNEMVKMEAYRQRLEREEGLSFIEFNYQLLQAYDFLLLFQKHDCLVQIGGDDQWGNILAGTDLIRRIEGKVAYGLTFPLLTTARGEKMGKTAKGAVWLSPERTTPYEFYQYWINTDDRDVNRFLSFFTFLPMEEISRLSEKKDAELQKSKAVLAYEVTKLAHGEKEAEKACAASRSAFGGEGSDLSSIPTTIVELTRLDQGIPVVDLFCEVGLTTSKSASRRLIEQGGAYINDKQVLELEMLVDASFIENDAILLRYGKKRYHRIIVRGKGEK